MTRSKAFDSLVFILPAFCKITDSVVIFVCVQTFVKLIGQSNTIGGIINVDLELFKNLSSSFCTFISFRNDIMGAIASVYTSPCFV